MLTASSKQAKASKKQAKGKAERNVALFCGCFALLVGKKSCHMLRFAFYGVALLCFWKGLVTCHGLRCFVRGIGKLSHVTVCFVLLCFALSYLARARGKVSPVTICLALVCFASLALLCFAFHCIAHSRNDKKANQSML